MPLRRDRRRAGPPQAQSPHHRRHARPARGGHPLPAGHRKPQLPVASNLLVFALFNLNLIVFLLLLVLLFRNLVKLSFERRQGVLGSRFKTKLVLPSSRSPSPPAS